MNKEEIEAIEILKSSLLKSDGYERHQNAIDIALNYIDKLQKENEELKEDNKKLNDLLMLSELDYVSKDKIKDKIKEIEDSPYWAECGDSFDHDIKLLKELLEE